MDEINSSDNSQIQWLAFDDLMERWGIVDFKGFFYAIVHQDLPVYKVVGGKHERLDFEGHFITPKDFNDENVFSHFSTTFFYFRSNIVYYIYFSFFCQHEFI